MKRISLVLFLSLFGLTVLSGCSLFSREAAYDDYSGGDYGGEQYLVESYGSYAAEPLYYEESLGYKSDVIVPGGGYIAGVEQQIIKTGSLDLHVEDVREAVLKVSELVSGWQGEVTYSNVVRGESSYSAYVTVRVPGESFEAAISGLKEIALYVRNEYTNAENVTEQVVDLESRLDNKRAEEQQYLAILEKAVTVEETLQVTQALSDVRYEIESLENQLTYYERNVAYSTIDLSFTEDESVSAVQETWRPLETLREASKNWVVFLQDLADGVIYLLIFSWPLIVIGLVWWLLRRRKRAKGR